MEGYCFPFFATWVWLIPGISRRLSEHRPGLTLGCGPSPCPGSAAAVAETRPAAGDPAEAQQGVGAIEGRFCVSCLPWAGSLHLRVSPKCLP